MNVFAHHPPPVPPPKHDQLVEFPDTTVPEMSAFIGTVLYFLSFFTCLNDILESEDFVHLVKFEEFEYRTAPVYLCIALFVGFVNYILAYMQLTAFELVQYGHIYLCALSFYFFSKHLTRIGDIAKKKANTICAFGALPLICLASLQADHVSVKSCRFFYFLMVTLTLIPLSTLFREWRQSSFDVNTARPRKRLFFLFFVLTCFAGSTTPRRACFSSALHQQRHRDVYVMMFDLAVLYVCSDAMWGAGRSDAMAASV
jgi:hypothetical protein